MGVGPEDTMDAKTNYQHAPCLAIPESTTKPYATAMRPLVSEENSFFLLCYCSGHSTGRFGTPSESPSLKHRGRDGEKALGTVNICLPVAPDRKKMLCRRPRPLILESQGCFLEDKKMGLVVRKTKPLTFSLARFWKRER